MIKRGTALINIESVRVISNTLLLFKVQIFIHSQVKQSKQGTADNVISCKKGLMVLLFILATSHHLGF